MKQTMTKLAALALLATTMNPASAAILDYTVNTSTGYSNSGFSDSASDSSAFAAYSDIEYDGFFDGNSTFTYGTAEGDDSGFMYALAYGQGDTYSQYATTEHVVTVQNDESFAQTFSYDFEILRGGLQAYGDDFASHSDIATAGYNIDILLNGLSIWNSNASLTTTQGFNSNLQGSGQMLGSYSSNSDFYSWDTYNDTLNLGDVAANSSFNLAYRVTSFVSGNFTDGCVDELCGLNESYAQFGDPFSFNGTPIFANNLINSVAAPTTQVVETESLALASLGLLGLAFRRRQTKS